MANKSSTPLAAMLYPEHSERLRMFSLLYFLSLLIVWNLLGHTILGFEQSWEQYLTAIAAACAAQLGFELVDAWSKKRPTRLGNRPLDTLVFFAPAIISGSAVGMLIFPSKLLLPFALASVLSIASKPMFRAPVATRTQHFFNPSNFGIVVTLFLCPWVSVAPPYHFMADAVGFWNWLVPVIILLSGIAVHGMATGRLPLIAGWLAGFVLQAWLRHLLGGSALVPSLLPMTSAAFTIFTLYMVPDPATTPLKKPQQLLFGVAVALVYGVIQISHQVYGLFGALFLVSLIRGLWLHGIALWNRKGTSSSLRAPI